MITRDNINDVIGALTDDEKNQIKECMHEYVILHLHIANAGWAVTMELTNDYAEQDVSTSAIIELDWALDILEEENENK